MSAAETPSLLNEDVVIARRLLRTATRASLATLLPEGGAPYASLVAFATDPAGAPLLLISTLAIHTQNLALDARASLLIEDPARPEGTDPLREARLSLMGRLERSEDPVVSRRFLARHPDAAGYATFKDFGFYRFTIERAHQVAGFGRITDLDPADILLDVSGCEALLAGEPGALTHMAEDHADIPPLYATRLLGLPEGDWRFTGFDPEGIDLVDGRRTARLLFPARLASPGDLRKALVALAGTARAA